MLPLCCYPAFHPAQLVSGSYYGHADVDLSGMHNNYLTELVIKQKVPASKAFSVTTSAINIRAFSSTASL